MMIKDTSSIGHFLFRRLMTEPTDGVGILNFTFLIFTKKSINDAAKHLLLLLFLGWVCVCVSFLFSDIHEKNPPPPSHKGGDGGEREIIKWKMTVQFSLYAGLYAAFNTVYRRREKS